MNFTGRFTLLPTLWITHVPSTVKGLLNRDREMKSCLKPSYVPFCHLTIIIAVCNKSKTVYNFHETIAGDNMERKPILQLVYHPRGLGPKSSSDESGLFFEELASKKVTGYYSFIPLNRPGQAILQGNLWLPAQNLSSPGYLGLSAQRVILRQRMEGYL